MKNKIPTTSQPRTVIYEWIAVGRGKFTFAFWQKADKSDKLTGTTNVPTDNAVRVQIKEITGLTRFELIQKKAV